MCVSNKYGEEVTKLALSLGCLRYKIILSLLMTVIINSYNQKNMFMRFSIHVAFMLLISVIICTQSDMKCFEELFPKTVGHG